MYAHRSTNTRLHNYNTNNIGGNRLQYGSYRNNNNYENNNINYNQNLYENTDDGLKNIAVTRNIDKYNVVHSLPKDEIVYTIDNRNYEPITTSDGELQYGQAHLLQYNNNQNVNSIRDNNYLLLQQQQRVETSPEYLHEYENDDYKQIQVEQRANYEMKPVKTKMVRNGEIFSVAENQLVESNSYMANPKGIQNGQTTNYLPRKQQLRVEEKIREIQNRPSEYYAQFHQTRQQRAHGPTPPHPSSSPSHTIVRHNPLSEAALANIPLERHIAITKQIPVVVKHEAVMQPFNQTVPIEVPQTVISTEARPIPIQIPVPQTLAVPDMRDLRIPIEKLRPYPVDRPIPYIVERHTPYQVERQVAVPYFYPLPIRVPIVNTVVHKSPIHKRTHNHRTHTPTHAGGWHLRRLPQQPPAHIG